MELKVVGRHLSPTGLPEHLRHPSPAASSTGDPPLKRKEENTREQYAPNSEKVFKLAEKPANPQQAEAEARLRVRRRARRVRNSEFKPQRLEESTNHSTGGGASRRGCGPGSVCLLRLLCGSRLRMVTCYFSAGREAVPCFLSQSILAM